MRKPEHSLAEQAFQRLKDDIVRCHFRPGEVLNEGDLAARYGMSKTPIREALKLLQRDGFVQTLPRRGILVRAIELQDVQNTFLLRMLLEPEAAALAAQRASKEQLKRISDLATTLSRPAPKGAADDRLTLHRALHETIADASGIRELVPMIRSLHEKVEWFYNYERIHAPPHDNDETHHQELAQALVTGEPERARTAMAESIRAARAHLVGALVHEPHVTLTAVASEKKLDLPA